MLNAKPWISRLSSSTTWGYFGKNCTCDWCVDRRRKYIREAESLPVEIARVRLQQLDVPVPVSCLRDDQSQSSVSRKIAASGQCVLRCADVPARVQGSGQCELRSSDAPAQSAGSGQSVLRTDAPANASKGKRKFKSERYSVRKPVFNDLLFRLHCAQPSVDAFADQELHLCPTYWGPGTDIVGSLSVSWKEESLVWCNPPWSLLLETVRKIIKEGITAVLICPHWPKEE